EGLARIAAFVKELQQLGWTDGHNLQTEYRWDTGDLRKVATELVAISPDVILAITTPAVAALQQATRTVPIGIYAGCRSCQRWLCCEPREAGRQYDWVHES